MGGGSKNLTLAMWFHHTFSISSSIILSETTNTPAGDIVEKLHISPLKCKWVIAIVKLSRVFYGIVFEELESVQ
jgi:hypothetical protein